MMNKFWTRSTQDSAQSINSTMPGVLISENTLPTKPFDRWKLNQLATWQRICFSPRESVNNIKKVANR